MDCRADRHCIKILVLVTSDPFFSSNDGGINLFIRVTPSAKQNGIPGLWRGADGEVRLAVKVTAPPDKGKANVAVIKLLANAIGLPKSALLIAAGDTSRLKTVTIKGEKAAIVAALQKLSGDKS